MHIGQVEIGSGHPTFVIAEAGINHNGDMDQARALIDMAVNAGCDAVKFQKRDLDSVYTDSVLSRLENHEQGFQYLIPILKDFELESEQMAELKAYADSKNIVFICTPFDRVSAAQLDALDVPAFKVASADLTDFDLLEALVDYRRPMILSTGMSTDSEIDRTVDFLREHKAEFALLHAVSSYPVDTQEANIRRIRTLRDRYGVEVGYSGHDIGTTLSVVAVSLGATIVEKHITLDRSMRGPDHKVSLLPQELERLVAQIREVEEAKGSGRSRIQQGEMLNRLVFRKSLVALKPIAAGQLIERSMIGAKAPGTGLTPQRLHDLVGRNAPRAMEVDDLFQPSDLGGVGAAAAVEVPPFGKWGMVVRYHDFESVLQYEPECLEFHLTHKDTTLDVPHERLEQFADVLRHKTLRVHSCEYIGEKLFDLCSKYPDIRKASADTLQRVVDITAELSRHFDGSDPYIVVNVGAMSLRDEVRDTEIDVEAMYEIVRDLELHNTHIMMQTMPPNPWYFGGQWKGHYFLDAQELIDFCEATGQFVCLDLSHAQMSCSFRGEDLVEYAARLRPYVKHLHIADAQGIEGEGVQIGEGDVDFAGFFKAYEGYDGTWIPEIWQGHVNGHEGARAALAELSEVYRNLH